MDRTWLGAILAGGKATRFGGPKALASIDGIPIVMHVRDALWSCVSKAVLITHEPALFADLVLRSRPDLVTGTGALGGVHAALHWAKEEDRPGALCVACDMPFLSFNLLRRLLEVAHETGAEVVAPESRRRGEIGVEPLCAVYSVACLPEIERRLAGTDHALQSLLGAVQMHPLPLAEVMEYGDPGILFFNVNTRTQHREALCIAASEAEHADD